jgi:hypothetical protein
MQVKNQGLQRLLAPDSRVGRMDVQSRTEIWCTVAAAAAAAMLLTINVEVRVSCICQAQLNQPVSRSADHRLIDCGHQ